MIHRIEIVNAAIAEHDQRIFPCYKCIFWKWKYHAKAKLDCNHCYRRRAM